MKEKLNTKTNCRTNSKIQTHKKIPAKKYINLNNNLEYRVNIWNYLKTENSVEQTIISHTSEYYTIIALFHTEI